MATVICIFFALGMRHWDWEFANGKLLTGNEKNWAGKWDLQGPQLLCVTTIIS